MRNKTIVLCPTCEGIGKTIIEGKLIDYHNGLYEPNKDVNCSRCGGEGRLIKIVKTEYFKIVR